MGITPIQPINLQQIAAATDAAGRTRQLQGDQAHLGAAAQAVADAARRAHDALAVHSAEESSRTHDRDENRDDERQQRRKRKQQTAATIRPQAEADGEPHIDIEC